MQVHSDFTLRGSAAGLFLFDISEEVDLDEVRSIVGARRLGEDLKHASAEQLFFERPPLMKPNWSGSRRLECASNITTTES